MSNVTYAGRAGFLLAFCVCGLFAQQDPPSRVARLNYFSGNVSMQPAGASGWMPAEWNRPFSTGDYLYTDFGARAELHVDAAAIRMGERTSFGFLNLNDQTAQIKLTDGDLYVTVHRLDPSQVFEVDTPNAAVSLLREGSYRFRIDGNNGMTFLVVRAGQAEVTGGGQAAAVGPGQSLQVNGFDQVSYNQEPAPPMDDLDSWCAARDNHEAHLVSTRYVPPSMIGYEDLDDNGSWEPTPEYGPLWFPRAVPIGWAPYRYGHWVWMDPWGWTWIDDARWGFAPFHYGRWVFYRDQWAWCPGPIVVVEHRPPPRPRYAPALVAWFGGPHWGVGIAVGSAPSVGWVALSFGELYTPPYHCSPAYFNNVNVSNTRVVNNVNITNVYQTVYVNKTVYNQTFVNASAPNAVTSMHQTDFASGKPVARTSVAVQNADFRQMQPAQSLVTAPPVAPARQAFVANPTGRPVAQPPTQIAQQAVVTKNPPPAQMAHIRPASGGTGNNGGYAPQQVQVQRAPAQSQNPLPPVNQQPHASATVNSPAAPPPVSHPPANAGGYPQVHHSEGAPARPAPREEHKHEEKPKGK